jgi:hypothetical protein
MDDDCSEVSSSLGKGYSKDFSLTLGDVHATPSVNTLVSHELSRVPPSCSCQFGFSHC